MGSAVKHQNIISLHLNQSFFRNLALNFFTVYVNALLISTQGAQSYAQTFFFSSLGAIAFYIFFLFLGSRRATQIYTALVSILLVSSVFFFFFFSNNVTFLYTIAVMGFLSDLIGPQIAANNIQITTNSALFKSVYQKVITTDLSARVLGSFIILGLNSVHREEAFFPLFWIFTVITVWSLYQIVRQLPETDRHVSPKQRVKETRETVTYFFENPLIRFSMIVTLWGIAAKFLVDYIFYQKISAYPTSNMSLSALLSAVNISTIVISLIFQKFVGGRWLNDWSLSSLLITLPTAVFFGCLATIMPIGIWGPLILTISFQIFYKGIQLPATRQTFVSIPGHLRNTAFFVNPILLTSAGILASFAAQLLKARGNSEQVMILLIAMTSPMFLLITRIDSFYLSNLWNNFRDQFSRNEEGMTVSNQAEVLIIDPRNKSAHTDITELDASSNIKHFIFHILSHLDQSRPEPDEIDHCLRTYYNSFDREELRRSVHWHRGLLRSPQAARVKLGLSLCETLGLSCFHEDLKEVSESNPDSHIRREAALILRSNEELSQYRFSYLDLETQFRFRYLYAKFLMREDQVVIDALIRVITCRDREVVQGFVKCFFLSTFKELADELLECVQSDRAHIVVTPLLNALFSDSLKESLVAQKALEMLPGPVFRHEVEAFFQYHQVFQQGHRDPRFVRALYLEEWSMGLTQVELIDTLREYGRLSDEEKLLFAELHLECLKNSPHYGQWKGILSQA